MNAIFGISGLGELRQYLSAAADIDALREQLYAAFLELSHYRDVAEWNAAVRLCEALAIIGWGEHEPLEAIRGMWFNGNPETYFLNRDSKVRFLDAVWSKRSDGFAIDSELSFVHGSIDNPVEKPVHPAQPAGKPQRGPLHSQRNWIAKNPIRIVRGLANCYDGSRPVIKSIEQELIPELKRCMRPELYGAAIDSIVLKLSFSFYDNYHCKTNYIIADESLNLKKKDFYPKLLEMFSAEEIEANGYYLRNRFTFAPFRTDTGKARVDIVLEKEFSRMPAQEQKKLLCEYLLRAVEQTAQRLKRKITYDFAQMISDFKSVLDAWSR